MMRSFFFLLLFLIPTSGSGQEIYFSPKGGCTTAIINQINQAKSSISMLAYNFTSNEIAVALGIAKKRGVEIEVIFDYRAAQEKGCVESFINGLGIKCYEDSRHQIAHNKVIIIDQSITITGSFNFTSNAENNNAENLIIINNSEVAKKYITNFELHKTHSVLKGGVNVSPNK